MSVQVYVLILVAHTLQILLEVCARDDHSATAVIGMKGERNCILDILVDEEVHMILSIINESEWRHTARFQSQKPHHPFRTGKREFATRWKSLCHEGILEFMF